jgi:DNA invertase Pin-like site-specific DNA recombinase
MAYVGYARVSSVGQSLAVQLEKLQAAGCDPIFEEKVSGLRDTRPELRACLRDVRKGDVLMVSRLDRLARSTLHLCQIAAELERNGVALKVLDQHIDTSDATGRLLFNMLGAIGQFETEIRAERQMEGIRKAQSRGIRFGRRYRLTPVQVAQLRQARQDGLLIRQLMQRYGLSKASVYRYLAQDQTDAEAAD